MNLGFVDHIEIYQGGNGIEFGSEPSLSTIRIYTKKPSRENGSQVQVLTDNNASSSGYIYYGEKTEDLEYSGYVSGNNQNRETLNFNNHTLSKDSKKSHFLATLKTNKFNLLISRYDSLQDGFAGPGRSKTPTGTNEIDKYHQFINASYNFSDNLKAYISIDDYASQMDFHEQNGYNKGTASYFTSAWDENVYKAGVKGNKISELHDFKYGFEFAQKKLTAKISNYDHVSSLDVDGPTQLDIYSLYFQDTYKVSARGSFITTFKLDAYQDNGDASDDIEPIIRVGYMHRFNKEYKAKMFLGHTYLYPSFNYTTTFSGKTLINPQLQPAHINNFVAEVSKTRKKYSLKLDVRYADYKDAVIFDSRTIKYQNSDSQIRLLSASFKFEYKFNLFNSLYFNFYKSKSSSDHVYSSDSGATLRLLNTYDKFNFFNEVVYRSDYLSSNNTKIDSGFDYSLGVTYKFNKKISLSFKGENILNNAIKNPVTKVGAVSNIDKKFMLGMEYSF